MAEAMFTIGAAVRCNDGPCGKVIRVVVDPVARALTHLVVEPEHRSGLGHLVPLGLVEQEPGGELLLRCTRDDLELLPGRRGDRLPSRRQRLRRTTPRTRRTTGLTSASREGTIPPSPTPVAW